MGLGRRQSGQAAEGGAGAGEHREGRAPARSPTPLGRPRPPLRTLDNEVRRTRSPQRVPLLAASAALGGLARYRGLCASATHPGQLRPPRGLRCAGANLEASLGDRRRSAPEGAGGVTSSQGVGVPGFPKGARSEADAAILD